MCGGVGACNSLWTAECVVGCLSEWIQSMWDVRMDSYLVCMRAYFARVVVCVYDDFVC